MKIKEADLAKALIKSFDGTNYDIYQEVETYIGIADIVLKYANFIWSIECKTSLSLQVIGQAFYNKQIYNYSSICVPHVRSSKGSFIAEKFCRDNGIGIFRIRMSENYEEVTEVLKAKINRKAITKHVTLVEAQKNYSEAGCASGQRWTPFNNTVSELKRFIKKNPGCKLKDALNEINHHYSTLSTAQSSIRQWINTGVIKGIELNRGVLTLN
ncbi:MAG: hypothetical protein P8X74_03535 [Reinekea sp.]